MKLNVNNVKENYLKKLLKEMESFLNLVVNVMRKENK